MATREQDIADLNALADLQQERRNHEYKLGQLQESYAVLSDKNYQIKVDYLPANHKEALQKTWDNYLDEVMQKRIHWLTAFCIVFGVVCLIISAIASRTNPDGHSFLFFLLCVGVCSVGGFKVCEILGEKDRIRIQNGDIYKDQMKTAQQKDKQVAQENTRRKEAALRELEERKKKLLDAIFDTQKVVDDYTYLIGRNRMSAILSGNDAQYAAFLAQQMASGRADTLKEALLLLDRKRENDERTAREERWRREDLARKAYERAEEIERHRREREEDIRREEAYRQEQDRRYRESVERQEKQYRESQENMERNRREDLARQERQRRDMEYEMNRIRREMQK